MGDQLGVALEMASQKTLCQDDHMRVWGYNGINLGTNEGGSFVNERCAYDTESVPARTLILGEHYPYARSAMLERESIAVIIEFAPNDDLYIKLDALYIDFVEDDARRVLGDGGMERGTVAYTISEEQNGLATPGAWDGFHSVVRNDERTQQSEFTTLGLNIEYAINDVWSLGVDWFTGNVEKKSADVESYSGVGRSGTDGRPLSPRSFQLGGSHDWLFGAHTSLAGADMTDPNLVRLADPQGWGGSLNPVTELN